MNETIHDRAEGIEVTAGEIAPDIVPAAPVGVTHKEIVEKKKEDVSENKDIVTKQDLEEVPEFVMDQDAITLKEEDLFIKNKKLNLNVKGYVFPKGNIWRPPYQLRYSPDQIDDNGNLLVPPIEEFGQLRVDNEADMTVEQMAWGASYLKGAEVSLPVNGTMLERMVDDKARWRNGARGEDGKYKGIRNPKASFTRAGIDEQKAAQVASTALLGGSHTTVFLVHSGFSVVIKPPTISQLSVLDYKVGSGNQEFGRHIKGMMGTHENTNTVRAVMDLFYSCLIDTSLGTTDRIVLEQNISWMDVETIAWVLACSKYPNGYHMVIPCLADPKGECTHVWTETVNIKMMWFVDDTRISPKQAAQISHKYDKTSFEDVQEYLSEFDFSEFDTLKIEPDESDFILEFKFVQPTVIQAFACADEWNASLLAASNEAFATPLSGKEKELFIAAQRRISLALNYVQFIESIRLVSREDDPDVQPHVIEDRESITRIVGDLAANVYNNSLFLTAVMKFVSMSTCALVGIPNLKCPSCGHVHEADHPDQEMKHLIKLDAFGLFIDLCQQLAQPYRSLVEEESKESMNLDQLEVN